MKQDVSIEFLTIQEVAQIMRVSPITIRRRIKKGELSAVRVGRQVRIPKGAVWRLGKPIESKKPKGRSPVRGCERHQEDFTEKIQEWLAHREEEDQRLYEQYGKPLEETHRGECIAIGPDGGIILGMDGTEVLQKAIEKFGSGNFALARIGCPAFDQWLGLGR